MVMLLLAALRIGLFCPRLGTAFIKRKKKLKIIQSRRKATCSHWRGRDSWLTSFAWHMESFCLPPVCALPRNNNLTPMSHSDLALGLCLVRYCWNIWHHSWAWDITLLNEMALIPSSCWVWSLLPSYMPVFCNSSLRSANIELPVYCPSYNYLLKCFSSLHLLNGVP